MDLSILESTIKALEDSLDSWGNWLTFFTLLVVFGLLFEYWHEIRDLLRERPFKLTHFLKMAGAVLVTLGVAGELTVEFKASRTETKLRDANRKVEALLRKNSDDEHLARINIEKQLAPRTLSDADRKKIGESLRRFAPSFSRRKVKISSYALDAEGVVFSFEIMDILTIAGVEVDSTSGRTMPIGLVSVGAKVSGPMSDAEFIKSLLGGIEAHLDTYMLGEWDPKYTRSVLMLASNQ